MNTVTKQEYEDYWNKKRKEPMTNEEWRKTCSAEEFAEWISNLAYACMRCGMSNGEAYCHTGHCIQDEEDAEKWLKQSHLERDKKMKYRKKPIVVEAFQFDGDLKNSNGEWYVPAWAVKAFEDGIIFYGIEDPWELYIKTLEGVHHVSIDDYIIQGVKGELYPCKPDIFNKTYEKVVEQGKTYFEYLKNCTMDEMVQAIYECTMANSWSFSKDGIKRWLKQPHEQRGETQ